MGFSGHKGWTYHHNGVFDVQHLRDACFYGHFCGACVVVRVFFFPVRVAERLLDAPEVFLVVLVRGPLVAFATRSPACGYVGPYRH